MLHPAYTLACSQTSIFPSHYHCQEYINVNKITHTIVSPSTASLRALTAKPNSIVVFVDSVEKLLSMNAADLHPAWANYAACSRLPSFNVCNDSIPHTIDHCQADVSIDGQGGACRYFPLFTSAYSPRSVSAYASSSPS